jgi:AcrR family transcriptional regulator
MSHRGAVEAGEAHLHRRLSCFSIGRGIESPAMGGGRPDGSDAHGSDADCRACKQLRAGLLQALEERDYALLTEREVAAKAGLLPSAFRRHYRDLDALLEATYCEVEAEFGPVFAAAVEGGGHWSEGLGDAVEAIFDALERAPGALRVYEAAWSGPPSLQRRRAADRRRGIDLLTQRAPELPELHAEFVMGALYRAAQEGMESPDPDLAQMRRRALELIEALEPVPA